MIDNLYARYGKLLIEFEILQGKINECKREIAQELNNPKVRKEDDAPRDSEESVQDKPA